MATGFYYTYMRVDKRRGFEGIKVFIILISGLAIFCTAGLLRFGIDNFNLGVGLYKITFMLLAIDWSGK